MALIECALSKIVLRETSEHQYIFLKELDGGREFPIVIGFYEAAEINRQIKEVPTSRPMTHELIGTLLGSLGARLKRVSITELKNNTFYALLEVEHDGKTLEVDSRPSDAIALAAAAGAPIFVDDSVIEGTTQI